MIRSVNGLRDFPMHSEIEHVCFVVRDMKKAARTYSSLLDVRRWYRARMERYEVFYRGNPLQIDWDIVMGYSGDFKIELIEVLRSSGPTVYSEVFGPDGEGFHHLCISVGSLDKTLPVLKQSGIEVMQHGVTHLAGGSVGRYAYVDMRGRGGCILELLEVRLHGIRLKNSRWLLRLGEMIGAVDGISPEDLQDP